MVFFELDFTTAVIFPRFKLLFQFNQSIRFSIYIQTTFFSLCLPDCLNFYKQPFLFTTRIFHSFRPWYSLDRPNLDTLDKANFVFLLGNCGWVTYSSWGIYTCSRNLMKINVFASASRLRFFSTFPWKTLLLFNSTVLSFPIFPTSLFITLQLKAHTLFLLNRSRR